MNILITLLIFLIVMLIIAVIIITNRALIISERNIMIMKEIEGFYRFLTTDENIVKYINDNIDNNIVVETLITNFYTMLNNLKEIQ